MKPRISVTQHRNLLCSVRSRALVRIKCGKGTFLCFVKHHAVKIDEVTEASTSRQLYFRWKISRSHWSRSLGGPQRLAGRLEKIENLAHAHEPNLGSSAIHSLAKSLYWLNCYVTIDTLHSLKKQELKMIVIYRQVVWRSEWDLLNILDCCVDLCASRLRLWVACHGLFPHEASRNSVS